MAEPVAVSSWWVASFQTSEGLEVQAFRRIERTLADVRDVAWADASSLVVLGAPGRIGSRADPGRCQSHRDTDLRCSGRRRDAGDGGTRAAGAGRHPRRRDLGRVRHGVDLAGQRTQSRIPRLSGRPQRGGRRFPDPARARHSRGMQLWATLVDLAIGRRCLDCGLVGASWCDPCLRAVLEVHTCTTPGGRAVIAAARYGGSVRSAVVNHKEQGHLALATPLGRLLAAATAPDTAGKEDWQPMLVPIPSTRASSRARGHDHARRLARAAGAVIGRPVQSALHWSREVQDQAGLSAVDRRANVRGAMHAERTRSVCGDRLARR